MFGEQVKLTLDLEIKEPEDVFFNKIVDIAVDSQNSIYILDLEEKFLYQFSEDGKFVKKIGHPGKGPKAIALRWGLGEAEKSDAHSL